MNITSRDLRVQPHMPEELHLDIPCFDCHGMALPIETLKNSTSPQRWSQDYSSCGLVCTVFSRAIIEFSSCVTSLTALVELTINEDAQ